jgi:hypothetical protein
MMSSRLDGLKVIECLPYQQGTSGFALPLFAHPTDPDVRLVQEVDEHRNIVAGFKILDDDFSLSVMSIFAGPTARIGRNIIHAFITDDGRVHAGTIVELKPIFMNYVSHRSGRIAVILQIQELIGSSGEKKIARSNMRGLVLRYSGSKSAQIFYEGSTLRAALWQHLLALAPNDATGKRVLAVRSRLSADVNSDGTIKLDLAALGPDQVLFDEQEIVARLAAEFDTTFDGGGLSDGRVQTTENTPTPETVDAILQKIRSTGRQEERIAILVEEILRERDTGIQVLLRYKRDRAKFAQWALHELGHRLSGQGHDNSQDELLIANLIPRFFTQQYPLARGSLLYYLAKHLAKWPHINRAIRRCLDRTASMAVDSRRQEIEVLLREASGATVTLARGNT